MLTGSFRRLLPQSCVESVHPETESNPDGDAADSRRSDDYCNYYNSLPDGSGYYIHPGEVSKDVDNAELYRRYPRHQSGWQVYRNSLFHNVKIHCSRRTDGQSDRYGGVSVSFRVR